MRLLTSNARLLKDVHTLCHNWLLPSQLKSQRLSKGKRNLLGRNLIQRSRKDKKEKDKEKEKEKERDTETATEIEREREREASKHVLTLLRLSWVTLPKVGFKACSAAQAVKFRMKEDDSSSYSSSIRNSPLTVY